MNPEDIIYINYDSTILDEFQHLPGRVQDSDYYISDWDMNQILEAYINGDIE